MRRALAFILLLSCAAPSRADSGQAGAAGAFLDVGVGGRPAGMGNAFTGVADDVDALYWNPGGLATFRSSQVTLQQTNMVENSQFQYLGAAQPIYTYGCLAAGIISLAPGEVERTDENFIKTGTFDSRESAYLVSYAQRLGDHWGTGATVKLVENVIDSQKASGYGADLGVMYKADDRLRIGGMIRNLLAPSYKFQTDTENFSRLARLGASYDFMTSRLLAAVDYEKVIGGPTRNDKWFTGLEFKAFDNISVRGGLNTDAWTAGAGVAWKTFVIDYAAQVQELGLFHELSLKVYFGGYEVDVTANPTVFSPVGLKRRTNLTIMSRNRSRLVKWLITIRNSKNIVVKSFQGYDTPPDSIEWDGTDSRGQIVEQGVYYYQLRATDNRSVTEKSPIRKLRIEMPVPIEIESK